MIRKKSREIQIDAGPTSVSFFVFVEIIRKERTQDV